MASKVRELLRSLKDEPPSANGAMKGSVTKPSRKESEKQRRDKLNSFISELADVVPLVKHAKKRLNKTGILRLTVNYLRLHQDLQKKNQANPWKPVYIESNFPIDYLQSNNSFLFVYNKKGMLTYISENVSSLLGHNQIDLLGQPISKLVHRDYEDLLLQQVQEPDVEKSVTFGCMMQCICLNSHLAHYENIQVMGRRRRSDDQDIANGFLGSIKEVYFVAVGKLLSQTPIHNILPANSTPLDLANPRQYVTRHYIDGSVESMDQRACLIVGYLSNEMEGISAYNAIHPNDLVFVAQAHQKVFEDLHVQSTCFRYVTRGNVIIYVDSKTTLTHDPMGKPKYILSFNHVVSAGDGRKLILKQRLALIKEQKAKKRARICYGEVSDEVDKNNDGAIVHLVHDQRLISLSVPFDDFRRREMQHDDLLIKDGDGNDDGDLNWGDSASSLSVKSFSSDSGNSSSFTEEGFNITPLDHIHDLISATITARSLSEKSFSSDSGNSSSFPEEGFNIKPLDHIHDLISATITNESLASFHSSSQSSGFSSSEGENTHSFMSLSPMELSASSPLEVNDNDSISYCHESPALTSGSTDIGAHQGRDCLALGSNMNMLNKVKQISQIPHERSESSYDTFLNREHSEQIPTSSQGSPPCYSETMDSPSVLPIQNYPHNEGKICPPQFQCQDSCNLNEVWPSLLVDSRSSVPSWNDVGLITSTDQRKILPGPTGL